MEPVILCDCMPCVHRYHARDASVILDEQSQRLAESMGEQDILYEYEYENRQCRPCGQGDNPRFFFGTHQEEDMNDVPCCSEDEDDVVEKIVDSELMR